MARYDRRATRHAHKPEDLDPNSQEYWEAVLRREGLSMSRGMRPEKVTYMDPAGLEKAIHTHVGNRYTTGGGRRTRTLQEDQE